MKPPFRADHVGSLLRPAGLAQARQQWKRGEISADELGEIEDRAIREAVRRQEEIGLRAVTDGEFRRDWWHLDFLSQLDGVTTRDGTIEDRDTLKRRIDEAAKHVPLEHLCLSPQCGFSSTHHGNALSPEAQWRKLELVVETAREVWGDA